MNRTKTLIHLHTDYSYDSDISLERLADFAEGNGFGCLAVTDHDTIEGALRLRHLTDAKVIVGEEISTSAGHLIGLFLHEAIRPGMSPRETALAIKAQGGLVFVPHPFNKLFGCGLGKALADVIDLVDAVEINNAQNALPLPDWAARRYARREGLIRYVGADSHRASSIGPCYQLMPRFDGPAGFLEALRGARLVHGRHPLAYFAHMGSQMVRYMVGLPLTQRVGINAPQHRPVSQPAHSPALQA